MEVISLLATGDFAGLLRLVEDERLDFKSPFAYDLATLHGKRDLVADVAAFANASGGILVVGVETAKHPIQSSEYCSAVVGVKPGVITQERVTSLVRQNTHPPVQGVIVKSFDGPSTKDGAIVTALVIDVPAAADDAKPVLADRLVGDDEKKLGYAVGWPMRHSDGTHWEHPSRIRQLLKLGLRPPASPLGTLPPLPPATDDFDSVDGWEKWGRLVLRLIPTRPRTISDFHTAFRDKANQWRDVRLGFGFRLGGLNELVNRGGDLVAEIPERHVLRIASDGQVIAAALASPDYLGWAQVPDQEREHPDELPINAYTLVEFCAETLRVAYGLVGPAFQPSGWQIIGRFEHLLDRVPVVFRPTLHAGLPTPLGEPIGASRDEAEVSLNVLGTDWHQDTIALVEALVTAAFGIRNDQIPLAMTGDVDPSKWVPR